MDKLEQLLFENLKGKSEENKILIKSDLQKIRENLDTYNSRCLEDLYTHIERIIKQEVNNSIVTYGPPGDTKNYLMDLLTHVTRIFVNREVQKQKFDKLLNI